VLIGVTLVFQRLRAARDMRAHDHTHNDLAATGEPGGTNWRPLTHEHGGRAHTHLPPGATGTRVTWRGLLALGVSGGLIPCPSALVLLLGAVALGRVGFGIVLVIAFSFGLAILLTAIGLLMVYAQRLFARFSFEARVPRLLPVASALVMALAGVGIVLEALRQAGVI
jgi:nickel/cobalt exporter